MDESAQQTHIANGPDDLMRVLNQLKHQHQSASVDDMPVILYQLGNQRSIIKVDFNVTPHRFYYEDRLGRPMTKAVEHTIAEFLWTYCGERERYNIARET